MVAKLATCNDVDCHRGIERGTVLDADGDTVPRVRVGCTACGVTGPWVVDDSVERAAVVWNEKHVHEAVNVQAEAADKAEAEERKRQQSFVPDLRNAATAADAESAHAELKGRELRAANKAREAEHFEGLAKQLRGQAQGFRARADEIASQA